MALFRRRREIADVAASVSEVLFYRRDNSALLAPLVDAGSITAREAQLLAEQLLVFELAVWFELFLKHLGSRDENTMGRLAAAFGTGFQAAFIANGMPASEAATSAVSIMETVAEALVDATTRQAKEPQSYDRHFLLAFGWAETVASVGDARGHAARRIQLLDIGKSVIEAASEAFDELTSNFKLVL